ncbi:carbohydrate ABC transporter permease [Dictyobacter aurantiacus]|uniref:Cytochrome c biogenesis protein n=1 Tax=Dictyobacter aurantiacus TaxID=1936993 RepID=A0A401ZM07_9CHLR|nr:sugar ABC transporter permease [Dictyobacter aurantiacus]GCE07860.1 cytochrome c biogenesis protein [Dictyobacter aurantiacus]
MHIDTGYEPTVSTPVTHKEPRSDRALLKRVRDHWTFYVYIAPFYILFGIFGAYPLLASLYYSLTRWDGLSQPVFVGLTNYINLFHDPTFLKVVGNSLIVWIGSTLATLVIAFVLAFLVNYYVSQFRTFFRVVFLFPLLVAPAMTAIIVNVLFSTNAGLINTVLGFFAGHKVEYDWFTTGFWLKPLIILMVVWRWTGWHFTLFLAGLQSIPFEIYEAGRVDGASGRHLLRSVTFPLMIPVILVSTVTATIGGLQIFDEPYVLTGGTGGTLQQGTTLGLYQYQTAFQDFNFGLASAVAWVIFALVVLFAILNFRLGRNE